MEHITLENIKKFTVLGSGTLGLRVGLQAALSGFEVSIYDIHEKAFPYAQKVHQQILNDLTRRGLCTQADAQAALQRVHFTTSAEEAAHEADFINESVPEDLSIKRSTWERFGKLCPPRTVFTTNTSSLLPSMMAESTGRPERFCAYHFHDVFYANLVDIMPHAGTASWVVDLLTALSPRLNQVSVLLKKEHPGYVFNAMLLKILGTAGDLLVNEVATVEDIDRSWMVNFKAPMGPFGILDTVGLETAWHVVKELDRPSSKKFAALLKAHIEAGKLGVKTGEGFYTYPSPAYRAEDFITVSDAK